MSHSANMPGFTADLSLGSRASAYRLAAGANGNTSEEVIAAFGMCYWATLFCVAAIFDGLPGDEIAACGAGAGVCGASAYARDVFYRRGGGGGRAPDAVELRPLDRQPGVGTSGENVIRLASLRTTPLLRS